MCCCRLLPFCLAGKPGGGALGRTAAAWRAGNPGGGALLLVEGEAAPPNPGGRDVLVRSSCKGQSTVEQADRVGLTSIILLNAQHNQNTEKSRREKIKLGKAEEVNRFIKSRGKR